MKDIFTVSPFENGINIITMTGKTLMKVFEHSVKYYQPDVRAGTGALLQVFGKLYTHFL